MTDSQITSPKQAWTGAAPDLLQVLTELYRSEINCEITSFYDGGYDVKLGDAINGWKDQQNFDRHEISEISRWLHNAAITHFPNSQYATDNGYDR